MHVTTKDEEGPQTSHFTLQISVDRPTKFELEISDFRRNRPLALRGHVTNASFKQ